MKMGILAAILLVIIIIFLIWFSWYFSSSFEEINALVKELDNLILQENFKDAYTKFSYLKTKWREKRKILGYLIIKNELDILEEYLDEIECYFKDGSFDEYILSSNKFLLNLKRLEGKNKVSFETIF